MTVRELLKKYINEKDISKQEARFLVCELMKWSFTEFVLNQEKLIELSDEQNIRSALERLSEGEPLAYIVGSAEFKLREFFVQEGVLIPREDTETIVRSVQTNKTYNKIADLGAGSGVLGITLALELDVMSVDLYEISKPALEVLRKNIKKYNQLKKCNLIAKSPDEIEAGTKLYDLIVSNPPYIAYEDVRIDASVKKFEPHLALYADKEGLDYYYRWTSWSYKSLINGGELFYEVGDGQSEVVHQIMKDEGFKNIEVFKDIHGVCRVLRGLKE